MGSIAIHPSNSTITPPYKRASARKEKQIERILASRSRTNGQWHPIQVGFRQTDGTVINLSLDESAASLLAGKLIDLLNNQANRGNY